MPSGLIFRVRIKHEGEAPRTERKEYPDTPETRHIVLYCIALALSLQDMCGSGENLLFSLSNSPNNGTRKFRDGDKFREGTKSKACMPPTRSSSFFFIFFTVHMIIYLPRRRGVISAFSTTHP